MSFHNDEKIKKNIEARKKKELYEKEQEKKAQLKLEKQKEKEKRYKIEELPIFMILNVCFLISIIGLSFSKRPIYILYSIISIFFIIYIGKRTKYEFDNTLNILLWNITKSLNDFVKYKVKINNSFENNQKVLKISSILLGVSLLFISSTNIIYGLSLFFMIGILLVTFANKDFELISSTTNIICILAFIGLIIKSIMYSIISGQLQVDFMNIIVSMLFSSINNYTSNLTITKP